MLWLFLAVLIAGFAAVCGAVNRARDVLHSDLEALQLSLPGQPDNSETLGALDSIYDTLERIEGHVAREDDDVGP